jgi:GTP-dependent phosphoenolpyruvate carboxykinase
MLQPALENYDITCEGDDIAWLKYDKEGYLRAINPGNYFFPLVNPKLKYSPIISVWKKLQFQACLGTFRQGLSK